MNMLKLYIPAVIFIILISVSFSRAQDSLLIEKIKNIDVSLTSTDETDEDLYDVSVSFQTFYDGLSPDGYWIEITKEEINEDLKDGEGQGFASDIILTDDGNLFIWRPGVNSADWNPYTNGKWIYTNQGWMWASNYSWGWAAYHYGRWFHSNKYGWVWMPGYVWAPAWVQWRISENHIGWCPLSPKGKWKIDDGITNANYNYNNKSDDWVFVDKSNFVNDINTASIINRKQNADIIKKSDRVVNLKLENSKVINRGPDVKDIENKTGKSIHERFINHNGNKHGYAFTDNDVTVYKEKFKRYDKNNGASVDKPKKYKRSALIKKLRKAKRLRDIQIRKHRPQK
jgi:hypothetical protein